MKIKFRIRTILLMTLALGIALACLRWVQQERLKHTDALRSNSKPDVVDETTNPCPDTELQD